MKAMVVKTPIRLGRQYIESYTYELVQLDNLYFITEERSCKNPTAIKYASLEEAKHDFEIICAEPDKKGYNSYKPPKTFRKLWKKCPDELKITCCYWSEAEEGEPCVGASTRKLSNGEFWNFVYIDGKEVRMGPYATEDLALKNLYNDRYVRAGEDAVEGGTYQNPDNSANSKGRAEPKSYEDLKYSWEKFIEPHIG